MLARQDFYSHILKNIKRGLNYLGNFFLFHLRQFLQPYFCNYSLALSILMGLILYFFQTLYLVEQAFKPDYGLNKNLRTLTSP